LGLDLSGTTVLEVGAGIGDHATFFLDRGCTVVSLEARPENLERISENISNYYGFYQSPKPARHKSLRFDLETDDGGSLGKFDVVYAYGILYHLKKPDRAVRLMRDWCKRLCLVETCVSFGEDEDVGLMPECQGAESQALHGVGCRPTRRWVFQALRQAFTYVYLPVTQPNHEEFPLDWTQPATGDLLMRAVFIASWLPLRNECLCDYIPECQIRCP
jgi:hypothetical protein